MTGLPGAATFPVALSVTPAKQDHSPAVITVRNIGSSTLHVDTSTVVLHAHCRMTVAAGVTVSPEGFKLRTGQAVKVHVSVPGGHATDYGILFTGLPVGAHGEVLTGAVGSQVLTGGATSCVQPKALPAPVSHSLFNLTGTVILAVIVAGLLLGIWAGILHHRHSNRPAGG